MLRRYFDHPAITTDVIVGFPGETEDEFQKTYDYLRKIHFYEMHIFKYSKRQGTRAAVMENQVPEEIKTKRSAELISLGEDMSEEFRNFYIGKKTEVLFEEEIELDGKKYFIGHTREYVKAAIESSENLSNQMVCGTIAGRLNKEIYLLTAD